jgi:hypothetical protein
MNAAGAYFNRNLDSSDTKMSSATPKLTVSPKNFRTQDGLVEIYKEAYLTKRAHVRATRLSPVVIPKLDS